jgi:hypothetical protein
MKAILVVALISVIRTFAYAQGQPSAELYKPGDRPLCNVSIAGEFRQFTQEIGNDFTKGVSNLEMLLPEDFISTWSDGEILNKEQFIKLRRDTNLKVKRVRVREQPYNACLYGYLTIVTGVYVLEATLGDRDLSGQYRFTAVYAKHPGHWRLEALHSSRLAQQLH